MPTPDANPWMDSTVAKAIVGGIGAIVTTFIVRFFTDKKNTVNATLKAQSTFTTYMTSIAEANEEFREEIRKDLAEAKLREKGLLTRIDDLEKTIQQLRKENVTLLEEKLHWMNIAMTNGYKDKS